jgi:triphosphoribosyl-dephospho-CoA synthetase
MKEEQIPQSESGQELPQPESESSTEIKTGINDEIKSEEPSSTPDTPSESGKETDHDPVPESEEQFMGKKSEVTDESTEDEEPEPHDEDDYSSMDREELLKLLENFVDEVEVPRFKVKIASIRDVLSSAFEQEKEQLLANFLEEGGNRDDFQPAVNPLEERFSKALKKFYKKRTEYHEQQEKQRKENLEKKHNILSQFRDLIQNEDNMGQAFEKFHGLLAEWRAVGPVPAAAVQDLQLNYKFLIDKFYDYIKINRELQELDQRHNLDIKLTLCEQAEELYLEPSINTAFRKLHHLQDRWRETGPVPRDKKDEIWDRFKVACDKLFEKRKQYIEQATEKRKQNLEAKIVLCETVEAIKTEENWKHKDWQEATEKISEIQASWRKIGRADKNDNDSVWTRFKAACDVFYKAKNDFYQKRKQEYTSNLQLKTELCIQAEALQNSQEWRATTAELKRLQEEWKKIGHVGERHSEKIWKRFRTACDTFFKNKSEHFAEQDKDQDQNLVKKNELVTSIENYEPGADLNAAFEELKGFQRAWSEIGMVPLKEKDTINSRYKNAIDRQFDRIKKADGGRGRYQQQQARRTGGKTHHGSHRHDDSSSMSSERRSLLNKIAELKNDVQVWENNIGFFGKSKNADKLKEEFEARIANARKEIESLKEKLDTPS